MKYYYNKETKYLLIDENDYTPYLKDRGYEEITKEEYDRISEEQYEKYKKEHPEEFELIDEEEYIN